ncbi:MAG: hypothetical protein E7266_07630 [Lachnospiraceae bacterium]|nr:hypothetical protein [Lachnospiraceae bacterium]
MINYHATAGNASGKLTANYDNESCSRNSKPLGRRESRKRDSLLNKIQVFVSSGFRLPLKPPAEVVALIIYHVLLSAFMEIDGINKKKPLEKVVFSYYTMVSVKNAKITCRTPAVERG